MSDAAQLAGRTVLQIVPELDAGGAERTTVDVAAALAAAGARPLVLARGGRLVEELEQKGGVFLPFPAHTKNPLKMLLAARRLAAIIRREGVAIVHARSRAPAWVALWACRMTGTPFVTTWHGSYAQRSAAKRFYNSVMARGDAVIANSQWTARRILADMPQAAGRITVIHRGTDLGRFDPAAVPSERVAALRRFWDVPEGAPVILVAARITPWKGHAVLIEAMAQMRAAGTLGDAVAVFAGDAQGRDDYAAELDALAAGHGLADRVKRVGHEPDVAGAMAAAAVVAVPSIEPEAFGRAAVEAQALGVPVVVTDHGAAPETVLAPPGIPDSGRTGWRVPPGDPAALAAALAQALALSPQDRAALSERARNNARRFSLSAMTDATLAVYARVLGHTPGK